VLHSKNLAYNNPDSDNSLPNFNLLDIVAAERHIPGYQSNINSPRHNQLHLGLDRITQDQFHLNFLTAVVCIHLILFLVDRFLHVVCKVSTCQYCCSRR